MKKVKTLKSSIITECIGTMTLKELYSIYALASEEIKRKLREEETKDMNDFMQFLYAADSESYFRELLDQVSSIRTNSSSLETFSFWFRLDGNSITVTSKLVALHIYTGSLDSIFSGEYFDTGIVKIQRNRLDPLDKYSTNVDLIRRYLEFGQWVAQQYRKKKEMKND